LKVSTPEGIKLTNCLLTDESTAAAAHTLQTSEDVTATSGEWNEAKLNEASLQQLF